METPHWNNKLPYAIDAAGEGSAMLSDIKEGLGRSLLSNDLTPGAVRWTRQLKSFLSLKYPLTMADRCHFIRIYYSLITRPDLPPSLFEPFGSICNQLLKKSWKLQHQQQNGGCDDLDETRLLVLEWRPLFEVIKSHFYPKSRDRVLPGVAQAVQSVYSVVHRARSFFAPTATAEILEEFLPKINVSSRSHLFVVETFLVFLLPTNVPPPTPSINNIPTTDNAPPFYWMPTVFSLWAMISGSLNDVIFFNLISRIAYHQVATPWNVGWTELQMQRVFKAGLNAMEVPVGSNPNGSGTMSGMSGGSDFAISSIGKFSPECFAIFIVWTMYPPMAADGQQEQQHAHPHQDYPFHKLDSLGRLISFIRAIDNYYHPSNSGSWSKNLSLFMESLSGEFLKRLRWEKQSDCTIPKHLRITADMKRQFVDVVKNIAFLSMFGKDSGTVSSAHETLRHLGWIQPELVFPELLERCYGGIEAVSETHRTLSCISVLSSICRPLLSRSHYPQGGRHLPELMQLILPGIDINDPHKSHVSFNFFFNACMNVPFWDLTMLPRQVAVEVDPADSAGTQLMMLDLDEEHEACRLATSQLEECAIGFIDRIFRMIENLPEEYGSNAASQSTEGNLLGMALHTTNVMFMQMSPEMLNTVMNKIERFINSNVIPNATKFIGVLCGNLHGSNAQQALKRFIPLCANKIRFELESGASSISSSHSMSSTSKRSNNSTTYPFGFASMSDSTLHWYQCILWNVLVQCNGKYLLDPNLRADLKSIMRASIEKCKSWRGYKWAGRLIRECVKSLTTSYLVEFNVFDNQKESNPDFIAGSHKLWGSPPDTNSANIGWHAPSDAEVDFAVEIVNEYGPLCVKMFKELMAASSATGHSKEMSNDFCKWLTILRSVIAGINTLTGDSCSDVMESAYSSQESLEREGEANPVKLQSIEIGLPLMNPEDPRTKLVCQVRVDVANSILELGDFFQRSRPDDVEAIKQLIKSIRKWATQFGGNLKSDVYSTYEKGIVSLKRQNRIGRGASGELPLPNSYQSLPRYIVVKRALIQHFRRKYYNMSLQKGSSKQIKDLIDSLTQLVVYFSLESPYAEIRKPAQTALYSCVKIHSRLRYKILPRLFSLLKQDSKVAGVSDPDKMKGAIYVLQGRSFMNLVLRNWEFVAEFLRVMIKMHHEDKPSIQALVKRIFNHYMTKFCDTPFSHLVSDECKALVSSMLGQSSMKKLGSSIQTAIDKTNAFADKNRAHYKDLITALIDHLSTPNLHWFYSLATISIVELVLREEEPISLSLVKCITEKGLLSEIPAIRLISITTLLRIFFFIKKRSESLNLSNRRHLKIDVALSSLVARHGAPIYTEKLLSDYNNISSNKSTINSSPLSSIFIDNQSIGFYCFPQSIKGYILPKEELTGLPYPDPGSSEAIDYLFSTFKSAEFWDRFLGFVSQESNREVEEINATLIKMYKSILSYFQTPIIDVVKSHIISMAAAYSKKNLQRCACELITGLVAGSKHWPQSRITEMWVWLEPVLKQVFLNAPPEMLIYWEAFIRLSCKNRDMSRLQPLVRIILSEAQLNAESEFFFSEAKKLSLVKILLSSCGWRSFVFSKGLFVSYLGHINHHYQQVRELLGSNLNMCAQAQWHPSASDIWEIMRWNLSNKSGAYALLNASSPVPDLSGDIPLQLPEEWRVLMERLGDNLKVWKLEAKPVNLGPTNFGKAGKTLLYWFYSSIGGYQVSGVYQFLSYFLPLIHQMQEYDDQDLQQLSSTVSKIYPNFPHAPHMISDVLIQMTSVLMNNQVGWRPKIHTLPMLQVLFYRHLPLLDKTIELHIMESIAGLLQDHQVEVREAASITLSGLIRCSQRDSMLRLKQDFCKQLTENPVHKRRRGDTAASGSLSSLAHESLVRRHSAVLGLSSIVMAFPYDVPELIPDVLVLLAGCISDPAPVSVTLKKMFADFRRTHQETWHTDSLLFTEDQLYVLNDLLISPSYYV